MNSTLFMASAASSAVFVVTNDEVEDVPIRRYCICIGVVGACTAASDTDAINTNAEASNEQERKNRSRR